MTEVGRGSVKCISGMCGSSNLPVLLTSSLFRIVHKETNVFSLAVWNLTMHSPTTHSTMFDIPVVGRWCGRREYKLGNVRRRFDLLTQPLRTSALPTGLGIGEHILNRHVSLLDFSDTVSLVDTIQPCSTLD